MKRILTFKHWQLFLLIVCTGAWTSPSPLKEIINSISLLTFVWWIYAIGVYGQKTVQTMGLPTLDLKLFKTNSYLIPILVVILFILAPKTTTPTPLSDFDLQTILLIPVVVYLVFAIFQTVVFACKTLATIDLKKEVVLDDYYVNLILTGFLIVGIWILQPKITRLIADTDLTPTA
jgi:hypothetical protein